MALAGAVWTTQPLQKLRNQSYLHHQLHQRWHLLAGQEFAPVDHTGKPQGAWLPNTQQKQVNGSKFRQSIHEWYLHSGLSDENKSKMHLHSYLTQACPPERGQQEWTVASSSYCCKRIASSLIPTPSITCISCDHISCDHISCDHISCDWRPENKARLLPLRWLTSFPVAQGMVRVPNWYLESTRVCFQLGHFLQTSFTFSL